MSIKLFEIINEIEFFAPLFYQENYDNSGLLVGDLGSSITKILISLDCTEQVVEEAISKGCNLIISHHPIIFRGLKSLTGKNYVERTTIKALKNDIAIYSCHTNLDNAKDGVNFKIAEKLGLSNVKVLSHKTDVIKKITVFVPKEYTNTVSEAMYKVGAGKIGNYQNCSFRTEGTGSFMPLNGSNPNIGKIGVTENVVENRVECIFPAFLEGKIISAIKQVHPYEEVAYYITVLENTNPDVGSGAIGFYENSISALDFLCSIKPIFGLKTLKYTHNQDVTKVKERLKVAVCGGAGFFLLPKAISAGADVFITSDIKYHEFFDAENKIILVDIGHYESEQFTKEIFYALITKKFTNIAVLLSETDTNPVKYL